MSLEIKATLKTPKVIVNPENGQILLAGISIPEDPYSFYSPINEKINEYLQNPNKKTTLEFKLEYFNTSSTLVIRNLIRDLSESTVNTELEVKWYYEQYDDDMKEAGEEFKLLFHKLNFNLVEVEEF
ncbi:DUF1987 domain-containing protein [Crocinitomix algicola]|uniref:DUF1987 domain-containing protein n=1 Tax=Crocinitomix algicola TaxID=1740263 RepID=UPI0008309866|nr:DUF1987 domain-containing protein [Crocinitomix algicola]